MAQAQRRRSARRSGRLDVFVRGTGNDLQQAWYTGGSWNGLTSLGGQITDKPGAVSWGTGRINVFTKGTDSKLWETYYDAAGDGLWHWANPLNQTIYSGPTVSSWGTGRLDVFFKGSAGDLLHQWYDSANGGWHAVESLGGQIQ